MRAFPLLLTAAALGGAYWYWTNGQGPAKDEDKLPSMSAADAVKMDALLTKYMVLEETAMPAETGKLQATVVKGKLGPAAATTLNNRALLALMQGMSVFVPADAARAARNGKEPAETAIMIADVKAHPEVVKEAIRQGWWLYRAAMTLQTPLTDAVEEFNKTHPKGV